MEKLIKYLLLAGIVLTVTSGLVCAQEGTSIGPGDVLDIKVIGHPEASAQATVGVDGYIAPNLISRVKAAGKTTLELARELESKYSDIYEKPKVEIRHMVGGGTVYILGGVKNPGAYRIDSPLNIVKVLAMAGGISPEGNPAKVQLIKGEKESSGGEQVVIEEIDVTKKLGAGTKTDLPLVNAGNTVHVVMKEELHIYVLGQVKKAGGFREDKPLRLDKAIALAEGFTPFAKSNSVFVISANGSRNKVDCEGLLRSGDMADMPLLSPGDTVYVP